MEQEIIYVKRFIKTEDDIPTEDIKWYYGHALDIDEIVRLGNSKSSEWDSIDWYFYPTTLAELIKEKLPSEEIETHKSMKVAYIAHPIGGDVKGNLKKIEAIGRQINMEEPNVIPFAHYFFDCHTLNDDISEERERGIKNNIALMRKGFIDEVRLYGDRISAGMRHEIDLARELRIKIVPMTEATKKEFRDFKIF